MVPGHQPGVGDGAGGVNLRAHLTQLKYKIVNSNGTIRLEEKEEMKKRLGKSPDLSDSLCLAYYAPPEGPQFDIGFF